MNKKFDSVKFQRERREKLSQKLAKMTPKEIVKYFKQVSHSKLNKSVYKTVK